MNTGPRLRDKHRKTLVIACGALATEILAVVDANNWTDVTVTCLPAEWHMTPKRIPEGMRKKIHENRGDYDDIFCLYGDCGTGGELDRVLQEEGVERIAGDHCYAFYAGLEEFAALHDAEAATFYLTDFLVRHFDTFVMKHLGIDRNPELLPDYFGNFRRVVYLTQFRDVKLMEHARAASERLRLPLEVRYTGLANVEDGLAAWRLSR